MNRHGDGVFGHAQGDRDLLLGPAFERVQAERVRLLLGELGQGEAEAVGQLGGDGVVGGLGLVGRGRVQMRREIVGWCTVVGEDSSSRDTLAKARSTERAVARLWSRAYQEATGAGPRLTLSAARKVSWKTSSTSGAVGEDPPAGSPDGGEWCLRMTSQSGMKWSSRLGG